MALSPAKAAQLSKALFKAGKKIKATASRVKVSPPGCRKCFAKGTEVTTKEGLKPIEGIRVGETVLAANEETGETQYKRVLNVFVNPDRPIWEVSIADAKGSIGIHRVTADHPYWVVAMGWVPVASLRRGMLLKDAAGQDLRVTNVRRTDAVETTFNLEVAELHSFFVGHQRVLVHNTGEADGKCGVNLVVDVARKGVDDFVNAAQGTVKNAKKGDIRVPGGRRRAKELFREFDVTGKGGRTKVLEGDRSRAVVGELEDGTPIRIRFKTDGTTRIQVGRQKFIFPE